MWLAMPGGAKNASAKEVGWGWSDGRRLSLSNLDGRALSPPPIRKTQLLPHLDAALEHGSSLSTPSSQLPLNFYPESSFFPTWMRPLSTQAGPPAAYISVPIIVSASAQSTSPLLQSSAGGAEAEEAEGGRARPRPIALTCSQWEDGWGWGMFREGGRSKRSIDARDARLFALYTGRQGTRLPRGNVQGEGLVCGGGKG